MDEISKLDEVFLNAAKEAQFQAATESDDYALIPPANAQGILADSLRGREAGFVLYAQMTPEDMEYVLQVFYDRPDKAFIRDLTRSAATEFLCRTLSDFCLEARRDGSHEISDAAFDNASMLPLLAGKEQAKALQTALDLISDMPLDTAQAWTDYYDSQLSARGIMRFEAGVSQNRNGDFVLSSTLAFNCPADCQEGSLLFSVVLDRNNLAESCYESLVRELPAIADMQKPDFGQKPSM